MTQPTVCAICLTADRQEMTMRAVRSFAAQDYPRKRLFILDSGATPFDIDQGGLIYYEQWCDHDGVRPRSRNIGALRNDANSYARALEADIIIHFDSDDWSAPTRIGDQVKLLVESGKQCVGYREMLFWRTFAESKDRVHGEHYYYRVEEAWLYRNTDPRYCLATSLCYWRSTWEAKPFPDAMIGSEREWLKGLDVHAVAGLQAHTHALAPGDTFYALRIPDAPQERDNPAMLATIHGSNTVKNQISTAAANPDGSPMWTRVPAWDNRVKQIIEGA